MGYKSNDRSGRRTRRTCRQHSFTSLRSSESRLKQFLNAIPLGIFIVDTQGKPYYINPAGEQIVGQGILESDADNLRNSYRIYLAGTEQIYPAERDPILNALQGKSVTVDDLEVFLLNEAVPLEVAGTPIYDEQGNIIYGMCAFKNITERKLAEQLSREYKQNLEAQVAQRTAEIAKAEEKFSKAFRLSPNAISDGCHIEVNESFCQMIGYSHAEIIGKTAVELNFWATLAERDRMIQMLKNKTALHNYELRFRNKSGTERAAYGYESTAELIAAQPNFQNQLYVNPKRHDEFVELMNKYGILSNFESQIYRKDGSIVWISENSRAVGDRENNLLYYEGFIKDITASKGKRSSGSS